MLQRNLVSFAQIWPIYAQHLWVKFSFRDLLHVRHFRLWNSGWLVTLSYFYSVGVCCPLGPPDGRLGSPDGCEGGGEHSQNNFPRQIFCPFFCEFIHQEAYSSDVSQMKLPLPSQSEVPSAFVRRAEVILSWVQSPAWHVTGVCPLITAHEGRKGRSKVCVIFPIHSDPDVMVSEILSHHCFGSRWQSVQEKCFHFMMTRLKFKSLWVVVTLSLSVDLTCYPCTLLGLSKKSGYFEITL